MYVPWDWAKQRPHFIAENLEKYFLVDVIAPVHYDKSVLVENSTDLNFIRPYLPYIKACKSEKFTFINRIINKINYYLFYLYPSYFLPLKKYDYVWVTDVRLYPIISKSRFQNIPILYDYMDDTLAFEHLQANTRLYHNIKNKYDFGLVNLAKYIFCSSDMLAQQLLLKYPQLNKDKIVTIYNAIDEGFINQRDSNKKLTDLINRLKSTGNKIILYVGTIEKWMHYDWLVKSLDKHEDITYIIVGPNLAKFKDAPRLKFVGTIEHKYLYNLLQLADILIMPFFVIKLIESVDPVKIYEYLVVNKSIILPYYNEVEKFAKYPNINFYNNEEEFYIKLSQCLRAPTIKSEFDIKNFINNNSWRTRVDKIVNYISA